MKNIKSIWLLLLAASALTLNAQNTIIEINTELGTITLELYNEKAPVTVINFLQYIDEKR